MGTQVLSNLMSGSRTSNTDLGSLIKQLVAADDSLRLTVYDGHAPHAHPRLAAHCEARRRAALRLMGAVVRDCGGAWGFGDSREPGGGTRTWASLLRSGAAGYLG
ncbi:hypothetical protein ACIPUC_28095 [Streptomyces sp. LARHCF249]